MIVTAVVFPAFLLALLATSRLMRIGWRTALVFEALSATFGLASFSALTTIPQLSIHRLSSLSPQEEIAVAPLIFTFELLIGTYSASKILEKDFVSYLKLTMATLLLTTAVCVPLILLALSG